MLEVQTTPPTNIQLCGEHSNEDSLLHEAGLAKPISGLDPNLQDKADAIQALAPRYACLKSALLDYLLTDRPLSEIAREHSYTATAVGSEKSIIFRKG